MAKHSMGDIDPTEAAAADGTATLNDAPLNDLPDGAASGLDPNALRFITRGVSAAERAAVTAVLGGVLEQESAMLGAAPGRGRSAWQTSQRVLRAPIEPGHGRWNRPTL